MADQMTPADLSALRALADAATPGPWLLRGSNGGGDDHLEWVTNAQGHPILLGDRCECDEDCADKEFVAAARTAVPRLLDLAEGLAAERDEARETANSHRANYALLYDRAGAAVARADAAEAERDGYLTALRVQQERTADAEAERDAARAEVAEQSRLRQIEEAHRVTEEANVARLAQERARLLAEVAASAESYRKKCKEAQALAASRAEWMAEVERLRGARTALYDALVLLVEWGARGHNPKDIAPWIRATQVLKDARTVLGEEGTK